METDMRAKFAILAATVLLCGCNVDRLSSELVQTRAALGSMDATNPAIRNTLVGLETTLGGVGEAVDQLRSAEGTADMAGDITRLLVGLLLGGSGVGTLLARKIGIEKIASFNAGESKGIAAANKNPINSG